MDKKREVIGTASNAVGKFIGSIPKVKDGPVDEFLIDKGERIKSTASDGNKQIIETFMEVSNPNIDVFVTKLNDMISIYNHTQEICCDQDNIY